LLVVEVKIASHVDMKSFESLGLLTKTLKIKSEEMATIVVFKLVYVIISRRSYSPGIVTSSS